MTEKPKRYPQYQPIVSQIGKPQPTKRSEKRVNPFYKTAVWANLRRMVLERDPFCRICGLQKSDSVDHIVPLRAGGAMYDENNLQGLCHSCHSRKTIMEMRYERVEKDVK